MKKIYLSVLAAAVAVTACDKSETINVENSKQQEVAFSPVNQPATKAPVETGAFPDDNTIFVSASNNKAEFFEDLPLYSQPAFLLLTKSLKNLQWHYPSSFQHKHL